MKNSVAKSPNNSGYMKPERSYSTNVTQSPKNINYSSSSRDLSPQYKDTTFGGSKRMHLPAAQKLDFIIPKDTMSSRYLALPRTNRRALQEVGLDAPSPTKYDPAHGADVLKPNRGNYSFGKPSLHISLTESTGSHSASLLSPGPGAYNVKHREMGTEGLKYSIDKQKAGYSYYPNSSMLQVPPVNKYDPKPTYLKTHLIQDGLGVIRGEKGYSYIVDKKTPGPGGYDLMNDKLCSPSRSLKGKIHPEHRTGSLKAKEHLPGPGHYNLVKPVVEPHSYDNIRAKAANFRELRRNNVLHGNI